MLHDQVAADDCSSSQPGLSPGSSDKTAGAAGVETELMLMSMTDSCLVESEVDTSKTAERKTSGASSDESIVEQWRRSIVVSDVPQEHLSILMMNLELKRRGGGKIDSHVHDPESRKVLVTFSDNAGKCGC